MKQEKRGFFRRFLGSIMLLLNLAAIIWLGFCTYAAYADPAEVSYIQLFSLTTPFAVIINMLFVFAWLFFSRRKLRALLSVIAIIACYKTIGVVFAFNLFKRSDFTRSENTLKVMSWNVHGMGIFNKPAVNDYNKRIIEYIRNEDADILCLPEFSLPKPTIHTADADSIVKQNGYLDYRFQADNTLGRHIFLGTAIFSRYPIHNFKANKLSEYIYLLQGDIQLKKGDTVRLFFVHLRSFGLSDYDKAYIEEMSAGEKDFESNVRHSKWFLWKFNYAYFRRSKEAKAAKDIINSSPYPVVVCGDLNDLPGSFTYSVVSAGLKDAFVEQGTGIGRTYNQLVSTLRIDYIFYNPQALECIGFKAPYTSLSDHNPVIANFEIKTGQ